MTYAQLQKKLSNIWRQQHCAKDSTGKTVTIKLNVGTLKYRVQGGDALPVDLDTFKETISYFNDLVAPNNVITEL